MLPAQAPRSSAPDGRRRGSAAIAVLLCLALAAAAVGIVGAMLLFGGDGGADDTTAEDDVASSASEPAVATNAVRSQETSPGAEESSEPPEQRFRCWDHTRSVTRSGCKTLPSGVEGLYWVFPQAQGQSCTKGTLPGRDVFLTCTVGSSSGKPVVINYTAWDTWDQAWSHYSGLDIQSSLSWPGMHGWYVAAHGENPEYKAALLYRDAPFSVTVYGASAEDRQAGLDGLVVRPAKDLKGERIR